MMHTFLLVFLLLVPRGGAALPGGEGVDLRPVFQRWNLTPRAQGPRGTCSVFAVTQAIEYAAAVRSGDGVRLSPEFLNWASNDALKSAQDGGFFSDLWKGYLAHGVCPDSDLPYGATFDPSLRPSEAAVEDARRLREAKLTLNWIKAWDVKTGLTPEHMAAIKTAIACEWPVCAGLRWPKKAHYTGRVLDMAAPEDVFDGHSVLFVGYRDDARSPGGGVFFLRNSGSASDDEEMTYEYAMAYTNDAAWIGCDAGSGAAWPGVSGSASGSSSRRVPESTPSLHALLDPSSLAPVGRNRRVSSNMQPDWHTENLDMTWLQPGTSVEMPMLEGPGVITHLWFTSHAGWVHELNALSLRIWFDGHETPDVEVPLGDFFAAGQGTPATVESIPVQVSSTGGLSAYWRMPFAKSAKITVTNDNPDRGTGLYWQVDYTQMELPEHAPHFHAGYRQEYPAALGSDYVIADLEGKGRFVGTVMSVTMSQAGWFGEGDDFFYVDGEKVPSLQGTGSEDYFNDAWGFRPRTSHWFGSPRWQGDSAGDSGVCYRWHVADAVDFSTSLKVAIEHKGNSPEDTEGFFVERPDFISSVALWYQEGPAKANFRLPPWNERRIPWETHHFVRSFLETKVSGGGKPKIDTSGLFGARPMLLWENNAGGASLSAPVELREGGSFAVRLSAATGAGYGKYHVRFDGKQMADVDLRSQDGGEADILLGTFDLAKGSHTVEFKAAQERQGPLAIETMRFLQLPPEAKRKVKTHHEAHFVRLAIGRATYAYRLAYGKLPESLQTLVDANVLGARYLADENNIPLLSRREGDEFVVESTANEKWTHRWTGLDARR